MELGDITTDRYGQRWIVTWVDGSGFEQERLAEVPAVVSEWAASIGRGVA